MGDDEIKDELEDGEIDAPLAPLEDPLLGDDAEEEIAGAGIADADEDEEDEY